MNLNIQNEYDPLDAVLVHRPGDEIDRLTTDNMRRFLFEDIPFLRRLQDEHDAFVQQMRDRGIQVLYLEHLLSDLLARQPVAKEKLLRQVCAAENVPALAEDFLNEKFFPTADLQSILFAGITHAEYQQRTGRRMASDRPNQTFVLLPIPNAYFSRDPAVVIGQSVISCKMHYVERVRETLLTRAVIEHHPEFAGHAIAYGAADSPGEDRPFTIEGGDVIVLNQDAVLIGASERTRSQTIEFLAGNTFKLGQTRRIYEIPIPTERSFMHLDTVFTVVDHGMVVWYSAVMDHIKYLHRYEPDGAGGVIRKSDERTLPQMLCDEFGREITIIRTGGGDEHYASREQRSDGTNVFAIAPKVACTYERNVRTIVAMRQVGIECIPVVGSELVRGLGGPRCMTMPLTRR